jgi:hypothetical protein
MAFKDKYCKANTNLGKQNLEGWVKNTPKTDAAAAAFESCHRRFYTSCKSIMSIYKNLKK